MSLCHPARYWTRTVVEDPGKRVAAEEIQTIRVTLLQTNLQRVVPGVALRVPGGGPVSETSIELRIRPQEIALRKRPHCEDVCARWLASRIPTGEGGRLKDDSCFLRTTTDSATIERRSPGFISRTMVTIK